MTIREAQSKLLFQLYHQHTNNEAAAICDIVVEHLTGWKRIDQILNRDVKLSASMEQTLEVYCRQLSEHRPVQYVLGECWFFGMKMYVDERVLIPRPETEELVDWIIKEVQPNCTSVLDVGTGSGCIAIALKKHLPDVQVFACDISNGALEVARKNVVSNNVEIDLIQADFLDVHSWKTLPQCDLIVSNPPYIPFTEKPTMSKHVTSYEPSQALFVDTEDPLKFYRMILEFGRRKLNKGGSIYAETHESFAEEVAKLYQSSGEGEVELRRDMQGKNRMIRLKKPAGENV